jgi:hypothetical protein
VNLFLNLFRKQKNHYLIRMIPFQVIAYLVMLMPVNAADTTPRTQASIHHQLHVTINPSDHSITATDNITLSKPFSGSITFTLHPALSVSTTDKHIHIKAIKPSRYLLTAPAGTTAFTLSYAGKIHQPLDGYGKEQSRGFRSTSGIIAPEGVYLAGTSQWYPRMDKYPHITFDLQTVLPKNWKAISQGSLQKNSWHETRRQEEIYLIAAPFQVYKQAAGKITAQVYLRETDEKLANKYLQATQRYLSMYESLLGAYPYDKFALVENFWETGYGMPSFTLLGSKVIRLPFILNSSYPHEILHNWWGNGVYVDYSTGNWSEGLTAYLADHLIREQQGKGSSYRQQTLQKYTDYAARGRDFPLTDFRGRHSSSSEAVGYGKSLMMFHMLRQRMGDKKFIEGLQNFYQQYRFNRASFADIQHMFEAVTKTSLDDFFKQWVSRTGAPVLQLENVSITRENGQYQLTFKLLQTQPGKPYYLHVPIYITSENTPQAQKKTIAISNKEQLVTITLSERPLRLDIDPEFDLFRKLSKQETPPAFTRVFGSKHLLVILPDKATGNLKKAYEQFATQIKRMGPDRVTVRRDSDFKTLPTNQPVTLIGWENRFLPSIETALNDYPSTIAADSSQMNKHAQLTVALTVRHNDQPLSFIASTTAQALPGLARKLPHYHKYSYLAFSGTAPTNILKGRWPVTHSPMTHFFTSNTPLAKLPERMALIDPPALFDSKRMLEDISFMSDKAQQGRGFGSKGLDRVANYISRIFQEAGLQPGGDTPASYFQSWQARGGEPEHPATLKNIIGIIPGTNPAFTGQSIIIGAHYDHLGLGWPDVRENNRGKIHYGADDNASGVAVLLELARTMGRKFKPERSIILVAFSGEEAGRLGSRYFVKHRSDHPARKITAMINLDTVGRLGNNKLLVLGGNSAREWQHIMRGIGFVTGISTAMVTQELDSSDQISFHEAGIPAIQLFSGANLDYHRPTDTPARIDPKGLLKVARVTKEVIDYLSSRKEPMTNTLNNPNSQNNPGAPPAKTHRKVSLGSIPDFGWTGKGYRLDGVVPGSPASIAGLQKGDVIIRIADKVINSLRDVSAVLNTLHAGQTVSVSYLREGKQASTTAILTSK